MKISLSGMINILICLVLVSGVLLTPFITFNEYLEHPISITMDLLFGGDTTFDIAENVNVRVIKYKDEIEKWTAKSKNGYADLSSYTNVLLAVMMAESGGDGTDPMQSSECEKNTRYPHEPGSILKPEYSIECGVKEFADLYSRCLEGGLAGNHAIYAAIDAYNKGPGILDEHIKNGAYKFETSCRFSFEHRFSEEKVDYSTAEMLKENYKLTSNKYWDGGSWRWDYGNMFYVYRVLSYLKVSNYYISDGTIGSKIVEEAYKKIGCRYWFGKQGPDYFDCSGLVYWCYNQAGIEIPRYGVRSYISISKIISLDQMQPGDCITFDWDGCGAPEHMGIYIGDGYMIHAPGDEYVLGNYAEYTVCKVPVSSGYYRDHIFNVIRIY